MTRPKTRHQTRKENNPLQKKNLEDSAIEFSKLNEREKVENTVLSWRVRNYSRLKRKTMYIRTFESTTFECAFRLFKTESNLSLCFVCDEIIGEDFDFLLVDELGLNTLQATRKEFAGNAYMSQFEESLLTGPYCNFLNNDTLTVSFKYVSNHFFVRIKWDVAPRLITDLDELTYDLKTMYLRAIHTDFAFHVGDYTIKAHKFVLSSRSVYFSKLFKENQNLKSVSVEGTWPLALHEVLLNTYSGEFKVLDLGLMLEIYEIGTTFQLHLLANQCWVHFTDLVDDFHSKFLTRGVRDVVEEFLSPKKGEESEQAATER